MQLSHLRLGLGEIDPKESEFFNLFCFASSTESHDTDNDEQVSDYQTKENDSNIQCTNQNMLDSDHVKAVYHRKVKIEESDEITCISSSIDFDEWGQSSLSNTVSRAASSSSLSLKPLSCFLSCFSFFPGNVSFRLRRATTLGSSRAYPVSSTSFTIPDVKGELHLQTGPSSGLVNRNEASQDRDLLPAACLSNTFPAPQYEDFASGNLQSPPPSVLLNDLQDDQTSYSQAMTRDMENTRVEFNVNLHSPRNHTEIEGIETRLSDRRSGAREPVEQNVRFSRTLSVGRLRDRVLRRSSFPDLAFFPLQQEREVRGASQGSGRQALGGETRALASHENALISPTSSGCVPSSMSSSLYSSQDCDVEISRAREARHHDPLEHRSNFLERRRRMRSQVPALQRLGNRFGNMSGHERSCILYGQNRPGHCTCRISTRDANSNDDTGGRASISRIVVLAEALFEVLDEIHQQSVVLSSQPSVSSIGSVPAPNEVVESLPVKLYSKFQRHLNEEAAQCYICLVEYEEGDSTRILPCHHEFHKTCIDKWLKEIHRVCPLCRRDICKSDSLPAEN
ncbi:hypothetical protein F0562_011798 [Nyssa sinensis]|uniref:RING-type domain-containing protein n=1 Tax=Nyssa sinensis TaxID=561372 RepID=A0A5J4ZSM2_9ASTE|nr:hypothetical protein F0562_011798 [Nyssa sinensis]